MRWSCESTWKLLAFQLAVYSVCPPGHPPTELSPSFFPSVSAATTSWTAVWADEFHTEDIDKDKWHFPEGDFSGERLTDPAVDGRSNGSSNDSKNEMNNRSGRHFLPSLSSRNPQVYIGAHEYLIMVAATPFPSQENEVDVQEAAAAVEAKATPWIPASRNRISTSHSANFRYGRVEVRARVSSGGLAGFWLMPSELPALGHTPCARVAIAEIQIGRHNTVAGDASSCAASLSFGNYEEDEWGCTNSNAWPRRQGGCLLTGDLGADWSDNFHVYTLEWEEDEFRWYMDDLLYCTKREWFEVNPDDFPAPFRNSFHLEMGIEVAPSTDRDGDDESLSASPPEMLVDYVRISQDTTGWWGSQVDAITDEDVEALADEGVASLPPAAPAVIMSVLALLGCVLGPYMAVTGLTHSRANTILMGIETGAFKAANASYLFSRSYMMALAAAGTFGPLLGYLALHHRTVARWNTVAGLAVPALFVLIDVGMISGIGSRYVCWAIFFVLSVTFSVLVFPSEHHALGFAVASAATGSCVLKLGLGWLLGESGEIFKILDDPLGDRCHVSRVCKSLNYVMGGMFFLGLCFQRRLRSCSENSKRVCDDQFQQEKLRSSLFTPPRNRSLQSAPLAQAKSRQPLTRRNTSFTSGEYDLEDDPVASIADSERQPALGDEGLLEQDEGQKGQGQQEQTSRRDSHDYDDDEAFILGLTKRTRSGGLWKRARAETRSILEKVLRRFSQRQHREPKGVPHDSPTPVPMPPMGMDSNATISNQGDTIELVIHSPNKGPLHHLRSSGWFGSFSSISGGGDSIQGNYRRPKSQLFTVSGEEKEVDGNPRGGPQDVRATAAPPSSSDDYDEVLSILSASELINDDPATAGTTSRVSQESPGVDTTRPDTGGRLAHAFVERWGAWANGIDSSVDDSSEGVRHGRRSGSGCSCPVDDGTEGSTVGSHFEMEASATGFSARTFDREDTLRGPLKPCRTAITTALAEASPTGATNDNEDGNIRFALPSSCSSSSGPANSERWVWRHQDGVRSPTSSRNNSGTISRSGSTDATVGGLENRRNRQENVVAVRSDAKEGASNASHDVRRVEIPHKTKTTTMLPSNDTEPYETSKVSTDSLLEIEI